MGAGEEEEKKGKWKKTTPTHIFYLYASVHNN